MHIRCGFGAEVGWCRCRFGRRTEVVIEEGAKTLNELSGLIDTSRQKEVAFKIVVTATGDSAYQRPDGIIVCPLGALRP